MPPTHSFSPFSTEAPCLTACPTETWATSRTKIGTPLSDLRTIWAMSFSERIMPRPRTMSCSEWRSMMLPPTLALFR